MTAMIGAALDFVNNLFSFQTLKFYKINDGTKVFN